MLREERPTGQPGGAAARRLTIQFEVNGRPAHDQAVELLQASREGFNENESGLVSSGPDGRCSGLWGVRESAYSVRAASGRTSYRHVWVLEEEAAESAEATGGAGEQAVGGGPAGRPARSRSAGAARPLARRSQALGCLW